MPAQIHRVLWPTGISTTARARGSFPLRCAVQSRRRFPERRADGHRDDSTVAIIPVLDGANANPQMEIVCGGEPASLFPVGHYARRCTAGRGVAGRVEER